MNRIVVSFPTNAHMQLNIQLIDNTEIAGVHFTTQTKYIYSHLEKMRRETLLQSQNDAVKN